MQMIAIRWFAKCGFTAAVLLLACGAATAWFGNGLQLPATTTRDGTLITLNRYAREPIPDVVLVGSSLTFRLKEEYFATPSLRNLALAGGSPVTGLEIVASQPRLPRIILVEANVLSRAVDSALVEKYSRSGNTDPLFFRPIRTAVAAYENWNHIPLTHARVSLALSQLLKQPPSDFDNHVYVDRAFQEQNAEDPTVAAGTNVMRIQHLIQAVEQRGARVLLFELPYSDRLEESRSVKITHEIVHSAFPDPDRWLKIDYPRAELRWSDGIHLDERSAVIVTQSIDRALSSLAGST
ncbi:hypothetical protein [Bradyrhizobium canariense]|uniref:SGNH hydrolase-type esterase domain-containing protein n=1 Tax=Bradyrhizobium canariense TaxID=255045 RepID=A0A1H2BTN7_9BRAD|nr:hypothetical protein [Bradyrhizobium canariense]SDT61591.1 hypothetical protein SAMN05444158_7531 [Bradyrhizobium canariense]